jgi:hypothetical protein
MYDYLANPDLGQGFTGMKDYRGDLLNLSCDNLLTLQP